MASRGFLLKLVSDEMRRKNSLPIPTYSIPSTYHNLQKDREANIITVLGEVSTMPYRDSSFLGTYLHETFATKFCPSTVHWIHLPQP